jgi:hypothetical protein
MHNYEQLNMPHDSNHPIQTSYQQIQDARAFAVTGGQPYGDAIIINVVFTLVLNTGLFTVDFHAWQVRPVAQKTWISFKVHFSTAHRDFRLTKQTAHQSGFHSANMTIENHPFQGTADAIAQLAVATASDRDMVATLTDTNTKFTSQLKVSQAYVKKLKEDIAQLKLNIRPAWQGQRPAKTTDKKECCWSHGYQVHNERTSASCKNPKDGHKKGATKRNPMG